MKGISRSRSHSGSEFGDLSASPAAEVKNRINRMTTYLKDVSSAMWIPSTSVSSKSTNVLWAKPTLPKRSLLSHALAGSKRMIRDLPNEAECLFGDDESCTKKLERYRLDSSAIKFGFLSN